MNLEAERKALFQALQQSIPQPPNGVELLAGADIQFDEVMGQLVVMGWIAWKTKMGAKTYGNWLAVSDVSQDAWRALLDNYHQCMNELDGA